MKALDIQSAKALMVAKGYEVSEGNDTWTNVDYASWVAFCRYNVTNADLPKSLYGLAIPEILEIERNLPDDPEVPLSFSLGLLEVTEVTVGDPVILSVEVTGGVAPYTYVWGDSDQVFEGENSNTFTFTEESTLEQDGTAIYCTVTDNEGSEIHTETLLAVTEAEEETPEAPEEGLEETDSEGDEAHTETSLDSGEEDLEGSLDELEDF